MSVLFCLFALVLGTQAKPAKIVVFGDSWGTSGKNAFKEVFGFNYGLDVANYARGGLKAADWAKPENVNVLRDAVDREGADYVWLTLGLDDVIDNHGKPLQDIIDGLFKDTSIFLDKLFNDEKHKDVQVVQTWYELLNWKDSPNHACELQGQTLFYHHCSIEIKRDSVKCQNEVMRRFQNDYVNKISKRYPNHRSIDLFGALQGAGGQVPGKYMTTDCIHLTHKGYLQYFEALWDKAGFSSTSSRPDDYKPSDNVPDDPTPRGDYIVNWVADGKVSDIVGNEGICGSSYAFAAMGAVESLAAIKTGKVAGDFSAQQIVDCDKDNNGCNGGSADNAFQYLKEHGICTSASYPYKQPGKVSRCRDSFCTKDSFTIGSYSDVSKNVDALKAALKNQPVVAFVDAQNWSQYKNGIFSKCGTSLNHYVLVVGYTNDFWLVKNSFGDDWGVNGYIKLKMGNTCGVTNKASYPKVNSH